MARVLIVDDEEGIRSFVAECLELDGHEVETAASAEEALTRLRKAAFALVVTDLRMPGMSGLELLEIAQAEQPEVEFIMITAHGKVETAVQAMKLGAFDYVQKPVSSPAELRLLAARALERRSLRDHAERTRAGGDDAPQLSYGDPAMVPVLGALERVAATNATVLLLGESGSGKEVAARAVHRMSARADGPFVAVNCATLSANLLESELFGHEKGAFTGATARKRGRIELASGGTFFLDELGEMPIELQAKLLRVLQERSFERVGGTQPIQAEVRWVAATNRDLPALMAEGRFREDLYHRVAVFPVRLPPLRERPADIVPLAQALLVRVGRELGKTGLRLTPEAAAALAQAPWPGNVRELANALERAAILSDSSTIAPEHLWLDPGGAPASQAAGTAGAGGTLEDVEKRAIAAALSAEDNNRRRAAERLGISVRSLYDKLKRYGMGN
ncbi:sigma-54-dependent transcriptional regulator [Haliangium ochraceum]|uniref:Two component, sigma54 specific, transcriptional regulator, Fis family n=1 Tax=Haliangium ochraceum (strain DSM 14365 / JCM 11303 / SMP-2) TaxID=502025 RepID=D0LTN0_HALO1|nr:sigma-54 dependent transcriptional regulator [Haliangium ochraceum]ACY15724.1 two component, sigma54 specific, transcriptional regulator, Fis family [Haliangium ochraceum DSM 14365]